MGDNTGGAAFPHVQNAVIESAEIQLSRGFILDCWLHLKFHGGGQGFGGFSLGGTCGKVGEHSKQPNIAAEFLCGVMEVAGVESFSALKGKAIRIGKDDEWGTIIAIGHITDDNKWFCPEDRIKSMVEDHKK